MSKLQSEACNFHAFCVNIARGSGPARDPAPGFGDGANPQIAECFAADDVDGVMDRVNGWAELMQEVGEPEPNFGVASRGIPPKLFIHARCGRLIETLRALQHDPH